MASGPAISTVPFTGADRAMFGQGLGDVVGGDRLDQGRGEVNFVADGARLDDADHEREELGRAQDGVGDRRGLDQVFLRQLGAEIAAGLQALCPDHRQGDVVGDAGGLFRGQQVAARGLEEVQRGGVLERRRVGDVDDDLGAGQRLGQTLRR
jgi:hypothetical protein